MPKVKISEYSATANSNTDVASINIDEGCAPSGINNAIRAIMGHLKDFQSGTSNDPFTVGSSGSLTLSYGTANGVAYLNGSKVLTTGSALTFDGTNLGLGGTTNSYGSQTAMTLSGTNVSRIDFRSNSTFTGTILSYQAVTEGLRLQTEAGYPITFYPAGTEAMRIGVATGGVGAVGIGYTSLTSVGNNGLAVLGNVGIGTAAPQNKLQVVTTTRPQFSVSYNGTTGLYLEDGTNSSWKSWKLSTSFGNGSDLSFVQSTNTSGTPTWAATAAMTLDASGNLLVGTATGSNHYIAKAVAEGSDILGVISTTTNLQSAYFMGVSGSGENAAASAIGVRKNSSTSRSINAAGTINASGADYAEYMTKAGDFTIAKGDVVGIDAQGKLTNVFANAVSFVVKSTDPSYVGGDVWGSEEALGLTKPTDESTQAEKDAFNAALEAARQAVDRIAFAGQVPVNVMGATAGQYIIPVNDNGAIKGEAVSNPTFEQYQISVGKVIAIESDGRAKIIVKVA